MSYATTAQAVAPFAIVNFTLASDSQPSTAQVQDWLDAHSVVLDNAVQQVGYLIPDEDTDAFTWLAEANRLYVGSQIGFALSAGRNEADETAKYLKVLYDEMFLQLTSKQLGGVFEEDTTVDCIGGYDAFPDSRIPDDLAW